MVVCKLMSIVCFLVCVSVCVGGGHGRRCLGKKGEAGQPEKAKIRIKIENQELGL